MQSREEHLTVGTDQLRDPRVQQVILRLLAERAKSGQELRVTVQRPSGVNETLYREFLAIKDSLNKRLAPEVRLRLSREGFESSDREPPFLMTPDAMQEKLEALSRKIIADPTLLYRTLDQKMWDEHLDWTESLLKADKKRLHGNRAICDSWDIRGLAAELVLQLLLKMVEGETYDVDERDLELVDRDNPLSLPEDQTAIFPVSLNFRSRYSCEVWQHNPRIHKTNPRRAEFDAVALSGFTPEEDGKTFSHVYFFDVTMSESHYREKMHASKPEAVHQVMDLLAQQGVETHFINILMRIPDSSKRVDEELQGLSHDNVRGMTLPLWTIAEEIAQKMAEDLEKQYVPVTESRRQLA